MSDVVTEISGEHVSPTKALTAPQRGAVVLMAGLVIVDVANLVLTFLLPELEGESAAAPPAKDVEAAPEAAAESA